jgi:AGCS family alanine or glycine:cation symporter
VCTITGLVILLSGVWNRAPLLEYDGDLSLTQSVVADAAAPGEVAWELPAVRVEAANGQGMAELQDGRVVYVIVEAHTNATTGQSQHRLYGLLRGSDDTNWSVEFDDFVAPQGVTPELAREGIFFDLVGASLTAQAFDSVWPGLGFWLVPLASWLFAFSTIISWSYYGEQGIVFLFGENAVRSYRIIYCLLTMVSVLMVETVVELEAFMNFGTGVMLWANIPIMLIFGPLAMRAYHDYFRRVKTGEIDPPPADVAWWLESRDRGR